MNSYECMENRQQLASEFKACRAAFAALGDETRQLIILALLESENHGIRVGEITKSTHLSRPAVSHHLKVLKEADIIGMYREGTKNYYYVNAETAQWKSIAALINHVCEVVEKVGRAKMEKI